VNLRLSRLLDFLSFFLFLAGQSPIWQARYERKMSGCLDRNGTISVPFVLRRYITWQEDSKNISSVCLLQYIMTHWRWGDAQCDNINLTNGVSSNLLSCWPQIFTSNIAFNINCSKNVYYRLFTYLEPLKLSFRNI